MVSVQNSATRRILGVIGLAFAAATWFFLAPQSVGGNVAYTVVTGQSMEPGLSASDLVIVREQPAYAVGDALAYRSRNLGQIVLHRVVAEGNGRFVMKGDNNDFIDSDQPSDADVLGKQWVHIPQVGTAFTFLRSTVGMSLSGVAIFGLLGFFSVKERRRRRTGKHRRHPSEAPDEPRPQPSHRPSVAPTNLMRRRIQIAAAAAGAATLVASGMTLAAFGRPLFRAQPAQIALVHRGTFGYSAPAPAGPVYQTARVQPGDPVFVRLVRKLEMDFSYDLVTDSPSELEMRGDMRVVVGTDNGWSHAIDVAEPVVSSGDPLLLEGRLDLGEVRSVLREVENRTGMAPGTYSVVLEPHVTVEGTVEGEPIAESFAPALPFDLSDIHLVLVRPQEGSSIQGLEQVLNPVEKSTVEVNRLVANPFSVWGREAPVLAVRRVGLVATALSIMALLGVGILWVRRRPRDEAARIEARFSSLLIPVHDGPTLQQETIEVTDIETLVRLAQQFEQPIMHRAPGAGGHSYSLYYDGITYSYRIPALDEDVPVLRFEPRPPAEGPSVRAVLTRPSPVDAAAPVEEPSEISR